MLAEFPGIQSNFLHPRGVAMRPLFFLILLSATVITGAFSFGQSGSQGTLNQGRAQHDPFGNLQTGDATDEIPQPLEAARAKKMEEERRKTLTKDADRLSTLIAELKAGLQSQTQPRCCPLEQ